MIWQPTNLPACLPARPPARLPACLSACLPACLPAFRIWQELLHDQPEDVDPKNGEQYESTGIKAVAAAQAAKAVAKAAAKAEVKKLTVGQKRARERERAAQAVHGYENEKRHYQN